MIPAPERDRALGMDFYITDEIGCGGVLRSSPEDFKVTELYEELGYEGGKYLILELEKKDWDTHHLIRELSRQLGISQKRFNWAGTKDKRAVTSQRISITYLDEIELKRIKLPDMRIRVLGKSNRAVGLGDLLGNRFHIKIRDINSNVVDIEKNISKITDEIYRFGGVPNYFGAQRFGEIRPITHIVGESLVRGMIEEAVFIYLAQPFQGEPEQTQEARRDLWETRDISEAIRNYPKYLHYELAILNYIIEHPGDYAKSFNVLSPNLRRLFVHAYQSYIFNRILSRRLAEGLPLNQAIEGDVVCFSKRGLADITKHQQVTSTNLDAVNKLINHHRAYVTLPLVGYESCLALGTQGEIERDILEEQAISPVDFKIPANVDLSSKGSRRVGLLKISPDIHVIGNMAELDFSLPPGSYATVVLREYMKSGMLIT